MTVLGSLRGEPSKQSRRALLMHSLLDIDISFEINSIR